MDSSAEIADIINTGSVLWSSKNGHPRLSRFNPFWSLKLHRTDVALVVHRNEEAIAQFRLLDGWRIFVTNVAENRMTLNQSTQYYRDEWLEERGFHRFKRGHIPAYRYFYVCRKESMG